VPLLWPGRYLVTLHDLTTGKFGRAASSRTLPIFLAKQLGLRISLNLSLKRAQSIIVPSTFVKKQVAKEYPDLESRVQVVFEAVDPNFMKFGEEPIAEGKIKLVLKKYGVKPPFLIYTGTFYPHKNVELLLEALPKLEGVQLVLVGKRDKFAERIQEKIKEHSLEDRANLVGFVPDEELAVLLRQASAAVVPSLSEGFGLPGLEAMSCGCPVLAAKASALPEIYGQAALYFDPASSQDFVKVAKQLLMEPGIRENYQQRGLQQVKKYSWRKLAEETLVSYQRSVG
jgi:glycosyltransferase involved in cell wall biosynthesis